MSKNPQIDPALDPQPVMTQYQAVGLAEGFIEGTEEEQVAAWQYLHDTGLAYRLTGMVRTHRPSNDPRRNY